MQGRLDEGAKATLSRTDKDGWLIAARGSDSAREARATEGRSRENRTDFPAPAFDDKVEGFGQAVCPVSREDEGFSSALLTCDFVCFFFDAKEPRGFASVGFEGKEGGRGRICTCDESESNFV